MECYFLDFTVSGGLGFPAWMARKYIQELMTLLCGTCFHTYSLLWLERGFVPPELARPQTLSLLGLIKVSGKRAC